MTPRTSALAHTTALRLAATEYERCADLFRSLSSEDWTARTECPDWDVRQMAAHMLGMVEMAASVRENIRQQVKGARTGGGVDALTALQVAERADWTPQRITDRYASRAAAAVRGRRRFPAVVLRRTIPEKQLVNGAEESWTFGYLVDVILTRDPWMHRIDITQATGAALQLTPEHDGVIVADVVAEWADRHGRDFELVLTGPAGGRWTAGENGPTLELDAVDFCRVIGGRPGSVGLDTLMSTEVPY